MSYVCEICLTENQFSSQIIGRFRFRNGKLEFDMDMNAFEKLILEFAPNIIALTDEVDLLDDYSDLDRVRRIIYDSLPVHDLVDDLDMVPYRTVCARCNGTMRDVENAVLHCVLSNCPGCNLCREIRVPVARATRHCYEICGGYGYCEACRYRFLSEFYGYKAEDLLGAME